MAGDTITLGPWPKGVNLTSNRDRSIFLESGELGEAVNTVLTPEGFIQPRPGCKVVLNKGSLYQYMTGSAVMDILGSVQLPDSSVVTLVQVTNGSQSYIYKVMSETNISLYFTPPGNTKFTHVLMHSGITGHTGIIFFSDTISKSYVTTDFTLTASPTLIASAIPASDGGMIVKDRLFLFHRSTSKFMWSPATYIFDWSGVPGTAATNGDDISGYEFIDATSAADGIMSVEFTNNSFYIFKRTKTYLFTYQAVPASDATLRKISDSFGALDSTIYRDAIVVMNNKGVFRIEGADFIDLQEELNLRFEFPLDRNNITPNDVFVTEFNNDIVVGLRDVTTPYDRPELLWDDIWSDNWGSYVYVGPQSFYYCLNGYTGGWTQWDFTYNRADSPADILASIGSAIHKAQPSNSSRQLYFATTFDRKYLVFFEAKPPMGTETNTYHLDTLVTDLNIYQNYYIPSMSLKTKTSIGGSLLKYKKIYRTFIRFYLSDVLVPPINAGSPDYFWTVSINHNDYRFSTDPDNDGNYLYFLYPEIYDPTEPLAAMPEGTSEIYTRTYQLPIPQQRAAEFVFELKRKYSKTRTNIINPDTDRSIKAGYYFLLSGVWFDYMDKAGI